MNSSTDSVVTGTAPRSRTSRTWVTVGLVVATCTALGSWWFRSPALTAAERALVGKWTLPTGTNPPPNALQQIFWFQPGRKFLFGHRPIGATATTISMTGTWRLEDGHLILKAEQVDSAGTVLARLFGQAPRNGRMDDRIRILGRDGETLKIEAADGSVAAFLPVTD
jgi:hypothetical protein